MGMALATSDCARSPSHEKERDAKAQGELGRILRPLRSCEGSLRTLLGEFLHARSQIVADGIEGRLKLIDRSPLHRHPSAHVTAPTIPLRPRGSTALVTTRHRPLSTAAGPLPGAASGLGARWRLPPAEFIDPTNFSINGAPRPGGRGARGSGGEVRRTTALGASPTAPGASPTAPGACPTAPGACTTAR